MNSHSKETTNLWVNWRKRHVVFWPQDMSCVFYLDGSFGCCRFKTLSGHSSCVGMCVFYCQKYTPAFPVQVRCTIFDNYFFVLWWDAPEFVSVITVYLLNMCQQILGRIYDQILFWALFSYLFSWIPVALCKFLPLPFHCNNFPLQNTGDEAWYSKVLSNWTHVNGGVE